MSISGVVEDVGCGNRVDNEPLQIKLASDSLQILVKTTHTPMHVKAFRVTIILTDQ